MIKTLKILTIAISLSGCSLLSYDPSTASPEQRAAVNAGILQMMANQPPIGQYNTYNPAIAGMIGRANNPIYVCSAYGCP